LLLWVGFVIWFVTNRAGFVKDDWLAGRRVAWYLCILSFLIGMIGIGLLSSIPNTFLFLLCVGWTSVKPAGIPLRAQNQKQFGRPGAIPVPVGAQV